MKFIYPIWLCFLCTINIVFAQSPIKMQGVAYDRQGELLTNATLFFQLRIHSDSLQGKVVWSDEFEIRSNGKAEYFIDLTDRTSKEEILKILKQKDTSFFIEESILREDSNVYETVFFQQMFYWNDHVIDTVAPIYEANQESQESQEVSSAVQMKPNENNTTQNDIEEEDMTEAELLAQENPFVENESETSELNISENFPEGTASGGSSFGNAKNGTISGTDSKGELISEAIENTLYLSVNKQKSLPEGRVLHQMANIGSDLYVVGGYNGKIYSKTCWSYNAKNGFWKVLAPMSIARTEHQLHAINNRLIAVGGTEKSESYVEVFDVSKNEWTSYAAPFTENGTFFTEVYKDGICWVEEGKGKSKNNIHYFNSTSGEWSIIGASPEVGRVMWFGSMNKKLVLVLKNSNQSLFVFQMEETGDWTKLNNIPVRMNQPKLLSLGADVYCIEGDSKGKSEKYLLKLEEDEWVQKPGYALYRRDASIICKNNRIVLIGGEGDQQRHMNLIEYYNPQTEQWESSARLLVGSSKQAACIIDQTIYISGGHSIKSFTSDRVELLQFY